MGSCDHHADCLAIELLGAKDGEYTDSKESGFEGFTSENGRVSVVAVIGLFQGSYFVRNPAVP